jgi:hypothetical protein
MAKLVSSGPIPIPIAASTVASSLIVTPLFFATSRSAPWKQAA